GQGVEAWARREFRRHDQLRTIQVWPSRRVDEADIPAKELRVPGVMSEARRRRLRQAIVQRWPGQPPKGAERNLTRQRLDELRDIEHVEAVFPAGRYGVRVSFGGQPRGVSGGAAGGERDYRHLVRAGGGIRRVGA